MLDKDIECGSGSTRQNEDGSMWIRIRKSVFGSSIYINADPGVNEVCCQEEPPIPGDEEKHAARSEEEAGCQE